MDRNNPQNFVFYGSVVKTLEKLKGDPELRLRVLDAIIDYGAYGEYEAGDPIVDAIVAGIGDGIDRAKVRYEESKKNGSKTHGNVKVDHDKIVEMHKSGMMQKDIAAALGCSTKTVQRHLKNELKNPKKDFIF